MTILDNHTRKKYKNKWAIVNFSECYQEGRKYKSFLGLIHKAQTNSKLHNKNTLKNQSITFLIAILILIQGLFPHGYLSPHSTRKIIPVIIVHGRHVNIDSALLISLDMFQLNLVVSNFIHEIGTIGHTGH